MLQESTDAIPLLSLSISVLIDALDVLPVTSLALPSTISQSFESFSKFLITILFQNVSKEDLKDDCLYGFGVIALKDNPTFLPFISEAVELLKPYLGKFKIFITIIFIILLFLIINIIEKNHRDNNNNNNDDDEDDADDSSFLVRRYKTWYYYYYHHFFPIFLNYFIIIIIIIFRDIAISSLVKIAFYSNDYPERFPLLIRSLSYFPLHNNILVARDSHQLIVSIFFQHNAFIRSNGNILNIFTQLFIQIVSFYNNLYSYLLNNTISYGEFFEEYSQKVLCYEVTINEIENYLISNKSKLNISSEIVKVMKKRNKHLNKNK